jgi:hypothetical protein
MNPYENIPYRVGITPNLNPLYLDQGAQEVLAMYVARFFNLYGQ